MKSNRSIVHYSLFAALIIMANFNAGAAVRIGNYSRGDGTISSRQNNVIYNNNANITNEVMDTPVVITPSTDTENNLPVRVADENLLQQITSGTANATVAYNQLEQCSMIYPNGEFAWDSPTIGMGVGGADTCVAVVELRGYQAAADGSDLVLARAQLAAGDSIKCNIDSFPESTMIISAVESFTFPVDEEPTMDDVIKQMNQEQKKNAGFKIAAATIIGGIGGNISGSNDPGKADTLFGTDKNKMTNTLIGALGGGALAAGSVYAGKVAGDVILSAGVNAAAGSVVGNISGIGNSVMRIEDCVLPDGTETTCLWGALVTTNPLNMDSNTAFYNIETDETYVCDKYMKNCKETTLLSIKLDIDSSKDIEELDQQNFESILSDPSKQYFMNIDDNSGSINMTQEYPYDSSKGIFAKIQSAATIERQIPAMVEMSDKAFGVTKSDWLKWKASNRNATVYGRTTSGTAYSSESTTTADIQNFYPMNEKAEDGGLIDFGNKARLKSTLIGAGVGGALGAFSGYQGAQQDVQNRWVTAVREYEDSLTKVYCATGNRYLSKYNDTVYIPQMSTISE